MKAKKKSGTKVVVATGTQGKGGRFARRKSYYAGGAERTTKNKLKRARRHVRAHPADVKARRHIEDKLNVGSAAALGLSCKGRKREGRAR